MANVWPEADELAALFARFVQGDPLARSDFIAAVLGPLIEHLRARRRDADPHLCVTAAEDAVLSLVRRPSIYDATKAGLAPFLRMAAERDLLNALQRERRHHNGRENFDGVELSADGRNPVVDEPPHDLPSFDDPALAEVIARFSDIERRVFELMKAGERRTSAFAEAMGIADRPPDEQARGVKRAKERVMKRLQRAGGKT